MSGLAIADPDPESCANLHDHPRRKIIVAKRILGRTVSHMLGMFFFESEGATLSVYSSHSNRHNAREAAKHLKSLLEQPQLSLF